MHGAEESRANLHARAEKLRDAKVTDFDGAVGRDEDVLSFDIAVQDLGVVEYARAREGACASRAA